MADIISYETFLFYQARNLEERTRREAINEHIQKMKALLGYEVDPIYKEEE